MTACGRLTLAFRTLAAALLVASGTASAGDADLRTEIRGRVLDAATGQPIAGALIVASWTTELLPNPALLGLGLIAGRFMGQAAAPGCAPRRS
jgi:hypothetical protein